MVDYLVVGAGLSGATIARLLADAGRAVMVVERRSHTGGNVHDFVHDSGIRVHTYGPHYFRTNSERIWSFVNRFAAFRSFAAVVMTDVDGRLVNWPVPASYIRSVIGDTWEPVFRGGCRPISKKPAWPKCPERSTKRSFGAIPRSSGEFQPTR